MGLVTRTSDGERAIGPERCERSAPGVRSPAFSVQARRWMTNPHVVERYIVIASCQRQARSRTPTMT